MPKADWVDDLHHDMVNDTEIHEECPQSVPPENCHKATPDSGLLPDENGFRHKHHKVMLDDENDNCTVFSYSAECIHKSPLMHCGGIALGVVILVAIFLVLCLSFMCMLEATVLQSLFLQEEESKHLQESSKGKRKLALIAWTLTPRLVRVRTFDSESEAEDVIFEHL